MNYKCLQQQLYNEGVYSIVPLRDEDKDDIRRWRNEQIYHLRQAKKLSVKDQEDYFKEVVASLFTADTPGQLLFSFLEHDVCVGYGGLVHINWKDKHAEISFLMNTALENVKFEKYWTAFLSLIQIVAFNGLQLHKIFTYAFDLRPDLYTALQLAGFTKEARLKDHCFIEGKFIDVVIHSKFNC